MKNLIIGILDDVLYKFHFNSIEEMESYWENFNYKNKHDQDFITTHENLPKKEQGRIFQLIKKRKRISDFSDLIVLSDVKEDEMFVYFKTIIDEQTMYEPFYGDKKIAEWFKVSKEELKILNESYALINQKKLKEDVVFAGKLFSKSEFKAGMNYISLKGV